MTQLSPAAEEALYANVCIRTPGGSSEAVAQRA